MWGYDVSVTTNGAEAWEVLQRDDAPRIAVLDWMMPEMDGIDVCRHVQGHKRVNDECGHAAGDAVLCGAGAPDGVGAAALRQVGASAVMDASSSCRCRRARRTP